jgi:hypothetical protein
MNTLLHIYVEIKENFQCMTSYLKVEKQNNKTYNNYWLIKTLRKIQYRIVIYIS